MTSLDSTVRPQCVLEQLYIVQSLDLSFYRYCSNGLIRGMSHKSRRLYGTQNSTDA